MNEYGGVGEGGSFQQRYEYSGNFASTLDSLVKEELEQLARNLIRSTLAEDLGTQAGITGKIDTDHPAFQAQSERASKDLYFRFDTMLRKKMLMLAKETIEKLKEGSYDASASADGITRAEY